MRFGILVALMLAMTATTSPSAEAAGVPGVLTSGAVGSSRQVLLVAAETATATTARLSWWVRHTDGSWHLNRSDVAARVGVRGMTTSKREGDGKTPMGIFPLSLGFGWHANPGTRLTWKRSDTNSRWVDDSSSAFYNRWMQAPANGRWDSAERLRITSYTYALDLGYNLARSPGKGSAIFLHLNTGRATAGCVSTDQTTMLATLRWLNPALRPVVVIGTRDWIARH